MILISGWPIFSLVLICEIRKEKEYYGLRPSALLFASLLIFLIERFIFLSMNPYGSAHKGTRPEISSIWTDHMCTLSPTEVNYGQRFLFLL